MAKLLITQVRSGIGRPRTQRETLRNLGLRRMHQTVERPDTPAIRGMVRKISHLLRVEQG
jgi:large subunit ribosomal protein L30